MFKGEFSKRYLVVCFFSTAILPILNSLLIYQKTNKRRDSLRNDKNLHQKQTNEKCLLKHEFGIIDIPEAAFLLSLTSKLEGNVVMTRV